MSEFIKNHKDGEKALKKIFFEIDRGHRMKKAEDMRKHLREKIINLKQDINKRNNKIYFLPYKKCYDAPRSKKKEKVVKDDGKNHPKLEDFLYDENDSYHIIEKKY